MGTQFMKGLQESGIISTAKHFPGHGDTHVDSHLGLPTLPHNLTRLEEVELVPFRESIHNGVDMIMTAHITFPSIDNTTVISKKDGTKINLPATLSKKVITGLLRTDLGFEGVIVSDAFTMKAISEHFGDENAAKMAVQAGVDIILTPQDVAKTAKAVVDAVRKDEIPEETIDQSVKRILVLKDKYHFFNRSTSSLSNKVEKAKHIVGSKDHLLIEQKIAEQAITLVKDEQNQLPHSIHNNERIVVLSQTSEQAASIAKVIKEDYQHSNVEMLTLENTNEAIKEGIKRADFVIIAPYQFRSPPLEQYDWNLLQSVINETNQQAKKYTVCL